MKHLSGKGQMQNHFLLTQQWTYSQLARPPGRAFLGSFLEHPRVLSKPRDQMRAPKRSLADTLGQLKEHSLEYQHLLAIPGYTHSYTWTLPQPLNQTTASTSSLLPFPSLQAKLI